jgi:type II secretory pathway component GspD/PulD (secretin)
VKYQPVFPVLVVLLGLVCGRQVYADYPIEVIELQSRTLEEVIPVIRPLLGPNDSVTGMGNNLVLKAPTERIQQVRRLLVQLDRPPQRLLITVGNQGDVTGSSRGYNSSADIRVGDGQISINSPGKPVDETSARIRLHDNTTQRSSTAGYQVQALEGRPAYINSGVRVPVSGVERYYHNGIPYERRTTQLQDVGSGFFVVPRLQGDSVMLEILQHDDRLGRARGVVSTQSTGTVVRGRLGEWLNLGGIDTHADSSEGGLGRSLSSQNSEIRQISVKVDCLDCGMAEPGGSLQAPFRYRQE